MKDKVQNAIERREEIEHELGNPEIATNPTEFAKLNKAYKDLEETVEVGKEYLTALEDFAEYKNILSNEKDPEMIEMAKEELPLLEKAIEKFEEDLQILLIPKDPLDDRNVILEIRAGAGGDESSIFAGDLLRMYKYYCEKNSLKFEITDVNEGTSGGYKEVKATIEGPEAYGILRYESGVHRVQRVPATESQGRVHTSAATVAIIPEAEDVDVSVEAKDLKIDTYRASGAGGQHVNKTDSAVRITHAPTGIVVTSQDQRSQHKNRDAAMKELRSRIFDAAIAKKQNEDAAERKSLVGTGDRSGKIRTYNYPQGRVTDHRINLTLYKLEAIVGGDISELIDALRLTAAQERMNEPV